MDAPRLHTDVHPGHGPPLLLVHGMLASRAQWLPNLEALSAISRPVVVELFGHARSPSPAAAEDYTPAAYVAAFERIRGELGVERWALCGQSLGAALTLRYSLEHPERAIAQLFTNSNSALADRAWVTQTAEAMRGVASRVEQGGRAGLEQMPIHPTRARRLPSRVRDALIADAALHDPAGIGRGLAYTVSGSSLRERIAENRVPTLLVQGERETRFAEAAEFARRKMPQLAVRTTPAGHAVNAETADAFNAAATAFLAPRLAAG